MESKKIKSDAESDLPQCSNAGEVDQAEKDTPLAGNRLMVASHYNNLREAGKQERLNSRIFHLRNFNNWIKSMLINEYIHSIREGMPYGEPLRVLDLCCGKGGDLLKWQKANISHLICTDLADVSIEQCKARYEGMGSSNAGSHNKYNRKRGHSDNHKKPFTAEFIVADATLVRLRERFQDKSIKLNLVSCQFAFHYSFESLSQAKCMIRNGSECLQAGGYFIATIPDANEIMRRLRNSEHERIISNEYYNIEFLNAQDPPPLFGAKYNFHLDEVVHCPEFLVHFATLVKLCRQFGLKLEKKLTFQEYAKEKITNEQNLNLLNRMNGLEKVNFDVLDKKDPEYAHCFESRRSGYDQTRSVLTLSKSSWDTVGLYCVCAFRKVKNTWDSKGNPVYEFDDEEQV